MSQSYSHKEIDPFGKEFEEIESWNIDDWVRELVQIDVRGRSFSKPDKIKAFVVLNESNDVAGFGSLINKEAESEYREHSDLLSYFYIPVLFRNPDNKFKNKGVGPYIMEMLEKEAVCWWAGNKAVYPGIILDVYKDNKNGISLYEGSGFKKVDSGIHLENNSWPYWVMLKRFHKPFNS